jgi:CubicO group peptidase (beta-lactamase class C family)
MLSSPRLDGALAQALAGEGHTIQVAAFRRGELVADAWAGDGAQDAVYPVFATGKAIVALAVHLQAHRGLLELDAPVSRYWPQYAAHGKSAITIRHVLSHRAGVPQAPVGLTPERLDDWQWITERLTEVTPLFEPGTDNAYMPLTFGWILGELVRRTDGAGRTLDTFVREELCMPMGAESFWFGIPPEVEDRVAQLTYPDPPPPPMPGAPVLLAVPPAVALTPEVFNRPDVHRAVVPAVGAISDARSLARLFSVYGGAGEWEGRRWLLPEALRVCLLPRPDIDEPDMTYGRRLPVGLGGLWIEAPGVVARGGGPILAHPGAGGSVAWAELVRGLSVAIVHNRMFASTAEHPDHPFSEIADAIRALALA